MTGSDNQLPTPRFSPTLVLIIAAFSVSFAAIMIRLCNAPPIIIGFYRLMLSGILLLPVTTYRNKTLLPHLTKKEWIHCILAGLFLALHFALWIESLQATTVASATLLVATQPLFGSLLGWVILGESMKRTDIIALLVSILGIAIISQGDIHIGYREIWGDFLALLAGALAAAYFLVGRNIRKSIHLLNYVPWVYLIASLFLAFFALLRGNPFAPYETKTFLWLFILALVPTVIGHTLFNWSLKYVTIHKVGMAIFIEPIGAILLAYLVFHEIPSITTYPGGLLVLAGLYITLFKTPINPESTDVMT